LEVPHRPSIAEYLVLSWERVHGRVTLMSVKPTGSGNRRSVKQHGSVEKDLRTEYRGYDYRRDYWRRRVY
jgi:hypothetical protein